MSQLRAALLLICQILITPVFAVLMLLALPFGGRVVYALARLWCRIVVFLARILCGIRYRVIGWENLPPGPAVIMAKHQSAWETLFFVKIFPRQVHVVKRELLRVPFFGWGLGMLRPIAINRAARSEARKQVLEQGTERLSRGLWVMIFPEGTRIPPGRRSRYATGGAGMAIRAQVPIVPVAHNAGLYWQRKLLSRRAGTITVSIGPAIDARTGTASDITARVEDWVETEVARISAGAP